MCVCMSVWGVGRRRLYITPILTGSQMGNAFIGVICVLGFTTVVSSIWIFYT